MISNYNLATKTNYKLEIPGADGVNYFLQTVNLPSVSMNQIDTPFRNYEAFMPANVEVSQNISLSILMDEDFQNYTFMYDWMLSFIDKDVWRNLVKDVMLHILSRE